MKLQLKSLIINMSLIDIFILSLVQGLTEFLPVSSSGHLIILPKLLGWRDQGLEMDVAVHIGTLCSVLLYFRQEIYQMLLDSLVYICRGFKRKFYTENVYLSLLIVLATLPAVIFGFLLKKLGQNMVREVEIVAFTSIFFGILLYVSDKTQKTIYKPENITLWKGILVGIAQALALIPGTSRSGACLTAGRFLGLDRILAAKFSFLLSIPAIMGAGVLTFADAMKEGSSLITKEFGYAVFFSFIFGLLAIKLMMSYLQRYSLFPFMVYRVALGSLLLWYFV